MELWFFYAIIGSVAIGINSYLVKLLADRKVEGAIVTFLQGMAYLTLGGIESILRGNSIATLGYSHPVIGYSVAIACVIFVNLRFRVIALRYLSSSEYYIGYRIFLTIILVIIGILFLRESISSPQLFGLLVGSVGILFLFEEDQKLRHSRNWIRAITFLLLSIVAGVWIQILGKLQGTSEFPTSLLLFIQGITMLSIGFLFDRKVLKKAFFDRAKLTGIFIIGIPASIFVYFAATFNLYAYEMGGSVSLVTKIYAYSLFIPILLSVLFSGEKVTYKKTIALLLTMVSLYYMV